MLWNILEYGPEKRFLGISGAGSEQGYAALRGLPAIQA
jgi:hypothetical protein